MTQKKKNVISCFTHCSFVRLTLWPSLARWFKRVTVSATHVTSSRAQINKSSIYFNVFLPSSLFSPSVAFMPFLTNISAQWPSLVISGAQTFPLSNTGAFVFLTGKLKAHTHFHSRKSYQTLSKTFSAPLIHSSSYWYMHISMNAIHWYWYWYCSIFANFKIFCAQSESVICHSYAHCGSNFAQLICCYSSITPKPAVSFRF